LVRHNLADDLRLMRAQPIGRFRKADATQVPLELHEWSTGLDSAITTLSGAGFELQRTRSKRLSTSR
jgi:hypothetical protein